MLKEQMMTIEELRAWTAKFAETMGAQMPITVNGVRFMSNKGLYISYSYENARGLICADNGFTGGDRYYPQARVSPRYSDSTEYSIICGLDLESIANAVRESWELFIKPL